MRVYNVEQITGAVERLALDANYRLPQDVVVALQEALEKEESPVGRRVLRDLIENMQVSLEEGIPLCQDCGLAVVFLEVGQDARIEGGSLTEAVHEGVRRGYRKGYLRASSVSDPVFDRKNTGDNTPAIIYTDIVLGDGIRIALAPKGAGSENMSSLAMLKPAQGVKGIRDFVVSAVDKAGSNPCPPVVVGVGIGGTADRAMLLAKKALLRKIGTRNKDPRYSGLEDEILEAINNLGIGPLGFGGRITALAVHIEAHPCHIASLPVAVNLQCHSARHAEAVL
jgi:fumarate hydratase subunit alpha